MTSGWKVGEVTHVQTQTSSGRSIRISVPGWKGNIAGQHLDVRLTAPDGYTAVRSYSIASVGDAEEIELAVDRLPDGEVSPYLVDDLLPGDQLEVRGPLGGWFVWRPEQAEPVQLIGGGSGIVPLIAMLRAHAASGSTARFRLLYSVRSAEDAFYADEIAAFASEHVEITWVYTRHAPDGWLVPAKRLSAAMLAESTIPAAEEPSVFVCGPTGFVESVATWLVELGHDPVRVKTERFGGA